MEISMHVNALDIDHTVLTINFKKSIFESYKNYMLGVLKY